MRKTRTTVTGSSQKYFAKSRKCPLCRIGDRARDPEIEVMSAE